MIDKKIVQETVINTSTFTGSMYSQVVGISVTDIEVTLEFAFINPRDKTKGEVVSRVTLPKIVAVNLAKTILITLDIHEKKKKGEKND